MPITSHPELMASMVAAEMTELMPGAGPPPHRMASFGRSSLTVRDGSMRVIVPRILAIDAGTTGMTALVVDEEGAVLSKGYREFPQHFPRPGWVEHDPEDWWTGMLAAATDAMSASGTRRSDVAAIGITNQRETTVLWDRRTMAPVAPAIVWQDRRTAPLCDELRDEGWVER